MAYKRGDVLLVPFPFSDLSTAKVRPAVVISSMAFHRSEPDIMLVAITSNLAAATGPFDYVLTDWKGAGLKFPSAFRPVIFTLDPARVLHKVGETGKTDMREIDRKLNEVLGLA
jgi:mRNA interferase MazF